MKAFILIISLGVSWSLAATDGPWYDYQGNQVRPAAQHADVTVMRATTPVVKEQPALGDQMSWGRNQGFRQRSAVEQLFYMPPYCGRGCRLPSAHHQPNVWRFRYRSSGVNHVIEY